MSCFAKPWHGTRRVEAHGSDHLCGLREVVHLNGRRPELGALTTVSVGIARYTGLLVEGVPA